MPFEHAFDDVYSIGIKEAAANAGVDAVRLDEQMFGEGMMERIYRQIEAADIIVADMSGRNANVFYEVGFAHAKEKLTLLLTSDAADIPFDLKHRRHIVYGDSIATLREELGKNFEWAKGEISARRSLGLDVKLKTSGTLKVSDIGASGLLTMTFDIHNNSGRPGPELECLYLYSVRDWSFRIDGHACPKTVSDLDEFGYRYFIEAPVKRLAAHGWAQLKLEGEEVFALKWRGDEIKDKYLVNGPCTLRFSTKERHFDYALPMSVEFEDLPF